MPEVYCITCGEGVADENVGKFRFVFQEESQDFCSEHCRSLFIEDPEKYLAEEEEGEGE